MREVILDSETTGIDPEEGHRIIELAALERIDGALTGEALHFYIDPGRYIEPEASAIHGLTQADVMGCPTWPEVEGAVLAFIGNATVVAHNARFDLDHIHAEVMRNGGPIMDGVGASLTNPAPGEPYRRWPLGVAAKVVCTRNLARQHLPDLPSHRLDDLLDHFRIDRSQRVAEGHGAYLDARLLAEVYGQLLTQTLIEEAH